MANTNIKFYKVQSLPSTGVVGGVYFCKSDKKVYIYTDSGWEDYAGIVDEDLNADSYNPVENAAVCEGLNSKSNIGHTHTKAEVGLGNVDNTADADKRVKYATSAGKDSDNNPINTTYLRKNNFTSTLITVPDDVPSSIDYIKMGLSGEIAGANRLFGLDADQIVIEQTTDGGETWQSYGASDYNKRLFFSGDLSSPLYVPLKDGVKSLDCALRITITGMKYNVPEGTAETEKVNYWISDYVTGVTHYFGGKGILDMFLANTGGTFDMLFETRKGNSTTWNTVKNVTNLNGWTSRNMCVHNASLGGYVAQTSNVWCWRFTFKLSALDGDTYPSKKCFISRMRCYSSSFWELPYTMGKYNHLYSWGPQADAIFPASLQANGNIYEG